MISDINGGGDAAKSFQKTSGDKASKMTLRRTLPQVLAVNAKNLLLLGYGTSLGFPSIVIPSVMIHSNGTQAEVWHDHLQLSTEQISWFSSINLLCVPVGCLLSGVVTQPVGRKPSMLALNLPLIAAWLLFSFAPNVASLYAALALTGLTGGLLEAPVLTYVAEITEPEVRGVLAAMSSMCVILGVFLQFLLGSLIHWRTVALANLAFPLAALLAIAFVPESPHWLIGRGRVDDARKSLQWLRGWVGPAEVEQELSVLVKSLIEAEQRDKGPTWRLYTRATFLRPYGIVSLVFFVGHFGGMTTLQTFAVSIFEEMGSPLDGYSSAVVLGLAQLVGSLSCMALVRYTGKRWLSIISALGGGLFFLSTALYSHFLSASFHLPYLPLVGLVSAAFMTHISLRLLPWMLIGEVYTADVRGTASGMSGGIGYILGFAANKSYLYLVGAVQVWGALVIYASVSLLGALAFFLVLPETERLTLIEVQELFSKDKEKWARSNPALETESHL